MVKFRDKPLPEAFEAVASTLEWEEYQSWYFNQAEGTVRFVSLSDMDPLAKLTESMFERVKQKVFSKDWRLEGTINDTMQYALIDHRILAHARYYSPTNEIWIDTPPQTYFGNVVVTTLNDDVIVNKIGKPELRKSIDKWITEFAKSNPGMVSKAEALVLFKEQLPEAIDHRQITDNLFSTQWSRVAPNSIKLKGAPRK